MKLKKMTDKSLIDIIKALQKQGMTRDEISQRMTDINKRYSKAKAHGLKMKREKYVKVMLYLDGKNGEETKN